MLSHLHNVLEEADNVVQHELDIDMDDDHEAVGNRDMGQEYRMESVANGLEEDTDRVDSREVCRRLEVDKDKVEHFVLLVPMQEDLHLMGHELLVEWHWPRSELLRDTFPFVGEYFGGLDPLRVAGAPVQCLTSKNS